MSDEGFHEIQLSGKQLVFLFMATTVVSVAIFLCGVLVGRGVGARQALQAAPFADQLADAGAPPLDEIPVSGPADADRGTGQAADDEPATDDLTYHRRLEAEQPPEETLAPEPEADEAPSTAAAPPPVEPPVEVAAAPAVPAGDGFTVQVAALRGQEDAEGLMQQLTAKGYPAYVLDPAPDAPTTVYRVRVGRYPDRTEAERVLRRLETEENYKPWITR